MTSKVLWGEGLFLRPHHFQQQDLYHEHRLHASLCALHPFAWGVQRIKIDVEKFVLSAVPQVRPDTCYFACETRGHLVERMHHAQSVAIYVRPASFPDLKLQLTEQP